ncbi:MAG: type I restriction enzyme HsdR N-terminal domain-containing protein [Cytophagales bacterium]|nr:type I restriction enzyme HsdR N-terminal domain-containing protein [Cytophagales bacterium]
MQPLNFPICELKIRKNSEREEIYDIVRRKYLVLTPEEWVRQHVVHTLVGSLGYSKSLLRLEGGVAFNRLHKRSDIVAYDQQGKSFLLVECKAPHVRIDEKVWHQAAVYNQEIGAPYVLLTNGLQHVCCRQEGRRYTQMKELPVFPHARKL